MGATLTKISNFAAFTSLKGLGFNYNSLTSFPTNELNSSIEYLDFQDNQLESLEITETLSNLIQLNLDSNPLVSLNINNSSVQIINISGTLLSTFKLSSLPNVRDFSIGGDNLTSIDFTDFNPSYNFATVNFVNCAILDTINLNNIQHIYNLNIQNCPSLLNIINSKVGRIIIYYNTAITSYDFSDIMRSDTNLNDITMYYVTNATSIDLQNTPILVNFYLQDVSALTTIIPSGVAVGGDYVGSNFRVYNSPLTTSTVNNVLTTYDSIPGGLPSNHDILIFGAPPTGAGITAKNNLIAKGWTVITN